MSLTAFPEPKDLVLPFEQMVLDGKSINMHPWSVENPHPGYGKDPNILNEFGHTKYPMFVGKVIVNNDELVTSTVSVARKIELPVSVSLTK